MESFRAYESEGEERRGEKERGEERRGEEGMIMKLEVIKGRSN